VSATLNLPPGVHAVNAGGGGGAVGGGGAARSGNFAAQANGGSTTIDCPAGDGTVTCTTPRGLNPGETVVLKFRLKADQDAKPGQVTGSVSAGSTVPVNVRVPVTVRPSPDALSLRVDSAFNDPWPWAHPAWVSVDVRNDGPVAKPATVTLDQPARLVLGAWRVHCEGNTCTSDEPLPPKEHLRLWYELDRHAHGIPEVTVTATVGTASASRTVQFGCWAGPLCAVPDPTTTPVQPSQPSQPELPQLPGRPHGPGGPRPILPTHDSPSSAAKPSGQGTSPSGTTTTTAPSSSTEAPNTTPTSSGAKPSARADESAPWWMFWSRW
jgi:hypothetical protein